MTRLIDAAAVIFAINENILKVHESVCKPEIELDEGMKIRAEQAIATYCEASVIVSKMPPVDALQVIRCKDCDHSSISATAERRTGEIEPAGYICKMWRAPTRGEGFCHKALPKRKGRDE